MFLSLPLRAAGLLAVFSTAIHAQVHWQGPDGGDWSDPANWHSGSVPGFVDTARIGSPSENETVVLDQPGFVNRLVLQDGMTLSNRVPGFGTTSPLTVADTIIVSGENEVNGTTHHATLELHRSPALYDLSTDVLNLLEGARLDLNSGAIANIHDSLVIHDADNGDGEARVQGNGVVNLTGNGSGFIGAGISLVNSGVIDAQGGLTFNQTGGGLYDLDGGSGGFGQLRADGVGFGAYDNLTFNGTGLTDAFSGEIFLRTGRSIDMNLSDGWAIDAGGEVRVQVGGPGIGSAYIAGGDLEFGGTLQLDNHQFDHTAKLLIESDTTITPTADIQVGDEGGLQFEDVTIFGGQFSVGQGAFIAFETDTVVAGGEFTTVSDSHTDGNVHFLGDTDYRGNVTFNGVARQSGDATVSQPTIINADRFDMASGSGVEWSVVSSLTINAENLDTTESNYVSAEISVAGNALSRLTVNLADPDDEWQPQTLNLNNLLPFGATRLAGSRVVIGNVLNIDGTGIGVDADATFAPTSETTFVTDDSSLVMQRVTRVEAGATFIGDGLLRNASTGHLTLEDGVSTDDVGLRNDGLLDIGHRAGIVSVDRFENTDSGTLAIDIGGHLLGDEFDHLQVSGEALIDGTLAVDLLFDDFENLLFTPEVGDEFLILTSLGGVSGEFADVLPTFADGLVFGWEVLYHPHDVTLRLSSVATAVPEPASLALLAFGAIGIVTRRR